jgi:hypothetical protein
MTSHGSIDNFFAICRYGDAAFLYIMQMMNNGLIDFYQTKRGTGKEIVIEGRTAVRF